MKLKVQENLGQMHGQVENWLKADRAKTSWPCQKVKEQLGKKKTAHGWLGKGDWPKKNSKIVSRVFAN